MVDVKVMNDKFNWVKTVKKVIEGAVYGAVAALLIVLEAGKLDWKVIAIPVLIGCLKGGLNVWKHKEKLKH